MTAAASLLPCATLWQAYHKATPGAAHMPAVHRYALLAMPHRTHMLWQRQQQCIYRRGRRVDGRTLGHTAVQFMIVWQRYSLYTSSTSLSLCSVASSRESIIHLHAAGHAAGTAGKLEAGPAPLSVNMLHSACAASGLQHPVPCFYLVDWPPEGLRPRYSNAPVLPKMSS
jgi:hypothetical protein